MLEGYGHMLLLIRNKHRRNLKRLLMMGYSGMSTISKKGFKTKMETTISPYAKGNEVIS
jgi:hypothetical protein